MGIELAFERENLRFPRTNGVGIADFLTRVVQTDARFQRQWCPNLHQLSSANKHVTKINTLSASRHLPIVDNKLSSAGGASTSHSRTFSVRAMIRIASLCLLAYWAALFIATHLPSSSLPKLHWSDKAYHAIAYAGLAFLLGWAIPVSQGKLLRHIVLVFAIGTIYGGLDELTQTLIPSRSCDFRDFLADVLGLVIGLTVYLVLRGSLLRLGWGRRLIWSLSR